MVDERQAEEAELRARRANSFGPQAAAYAEHRPDYPAAGIRWVLEPLGAKAALEAVDLGAGTGKLSAGLADVGARVIAVEPDEAMRAEFARRCPEIPIWGGSAEAIPLPDGSVDAVLAGQALHWFDQARAFPEIARVLRRGGVFGALWNAYDDDVAWVAGLDRVSRSRVSSTRSLEDRVPGHRLFHPFERAEFAHSQRRTAESLTATIGTHSHTLVITPEERAELLASISDYLRSLPETRDGEFDLPLRTFVIRAVRR
ncbi:class I SAM-dependent methyltransferase [Nocardia transvalensis]|uniref:class I SAM-dependent methyltransferase n=1 Tax=Nocardia transvalensis TaxID=37333 RepID=UPI001895E6B7|nr:class I SAM-dependent methyltransferase [Nocardia transvalensis]MBF6328888.1 class I SAM-dependent methyltransferase [Nocardia transvalensis]